MQNLEGKVAFITGGASGIGLGIAKACVKAGMKAVIADIRQDHLNEALAGFKSENLERSIHGILLDVTDREAFARAADEIEYVFGKVHLLCNNAGVGVIGPIKDAGFSDWDFALGVMLGGTVNGLQIFLPRILKHGEGGHIVMTSSTGGILPLAESVIYSTAKAALIGMCEALRGALEEDNIGVSAFCPGPVATNIRETGRLRPEKYRKDSGYLQFEKKLEQRPNSPNWMSIEECGERVLRGIRRNDLYIFTHREFKEGVAERMEAILAAFPDDPINHALMAELPHLFSNPVFRRSIQ